MWLATAHATASAQAWATGSTPRIAALRVGIVPELLGCRLELRSTPATMTSCRSASDVATPRFCSIEQDGDALVLEASCTSRSSCSIDGRREPLGRLVHDQELRIEQQRATDREHLLLAAGELRSAVPLPLGKAREELVHTLWGPTAVTTVAAADHAEVLVDAERGKEPASLRDVADTELRDLVRGSADQLAYPGSGSSRSLRGGREAHDRRAERRLSHAVAADHGHRLLVLDRRTTRRRGRVRCRRTRSSPSTESSGSLTRSSLRFGTVAAAQVEIVDELGSRGSLPEFPRRSRGPRASS